MQSFLLLDFRGNGNIHVYLHRTTQIICTKVTLHYASYLFFWFFFICWVLSQYLLGSAPSSHIFLKSLSCVYSDNNTCSMLASRNGTMKANYAYFQFKYLPMHVPWLIPFVHLQPPSMPQISCHIQSD